MATPKLYKTSTGEYTLYLEEIDETYHSRHGAISESLHVFIENGFRKVVDSKEIRILEIGLGTGLNALLSILEADRSSNTLWYHSLEPYPIDLQIAEAINYGDQISSPKATEFFLDIHNAPWHEWTEISPTFQLYKDQTKLEDIELAKEKYDVIYFDAFAPKKQEELWRETHFLKLFSALKHGGILTTYSAAGQLKRNLKSAGFEVQCPPGANGKREMTIGIKP